MIRQSANKSETGDSAKLKEIPYLVYQITPDEIADALKVTYNGDEDTFNAIDALGDTIRGSHTNVELYKAFIRNLNATGVNPFAPYTQIPFHSQDPTAENPASTAWWIIGQSAPATQQTMDDIFNVTYPLEGKFDQAGELIDRQILAARRARKPTESGPQYHSVPGNLVGTAIRYELLKGLSSRRSQYPEIFARHFSYTEQRIKNRLGPLRRVLYPSRDTFTYRPYPIGTANPTQYEMDLLWQYYLKLQQVKNSKEFVQYVPYN